MRPLPVNQPAALLEHELVGGARPQHPVSVRPHEDRAHVAEAAFDRHAAHRAHAETVTRRMAGEQFHAVFFCRLAHAIGFVEVDRHRLLDRNVLAVAHRFDGVLAMILVGRRDPDRFDVRILSQSGDRVVRARAGIAFLEAFAHLRVDVGARDQIDFRHRRHRRHHAAGPLPKAGNTHAQGPHVQTPTTSLARENAASNSASIPA